ncbi:MAG: TusE/DsrC/DsvC family sulfur relay protein [Akkermansiaceae bacterium]|nr:TusE/DsrC/DsvC family sulfur relay protein [Verrucomicrobiae bacterium]MCP5554494.1 TusE/DsrC/DsvC family sulfur relay protein [Akkermansiaceae bacterium]
MNKEIAGTTVEVNEEGYLTDMSQWNEAIAAAIAAEEGVGPLGDGHWKVIRYLREQQAKGAALTIRSMGKSGIVTTKELYDLFPGGPLKKSSKIAGIPKPVGCI